MINNKINLIFQMKRTLKDRDYTFRVPGFITKLYEILNVNSEFSQMSINKLLSGEKMDYHL